MSLVLALCSSFLAAPAQAAQAPAPSTASPRDQAQSFRPFQPAPRASNPEGDIGVLTGLPYEGAPTFEIVDKSAPLPPPMRAELDDSVPLPNPPLYETGPNGDVLVAPASGDPFYLGFAAGKHFPPADERVDPALYARLRSSYADARPDAETYAFVMFEKRITQGRVAELEALGARVLQFHPYYTLKVALRADAVDRVANHPAVRWVGDAQPWQKVHPALVEQLDAAPSGAWVDVTIDVFETDLCAQSEPVLGPAPEAVVNGVTVVVGRAQPLPNVWRTNGWMQHALEKVGVEVFDYSEAIQAFRARLPAAALELVTQLDFVQFVEWRAPEQLMHDESMPQANLDALRNVYDGGFNQRAVAAIADSGVNISHTALDHLYHIGFNVSGGAGGPFTDACNHGSHVCGTMAAEAANPSQNGAAPGLGWGDTGRLFIVRILPTCTGFVNVANLVALLAQGFTDVGGAYTPFAQVVNNSWGTGGTGNPATAWKGSEADCRSYDFQAFNGAQLNVFAAGNRGPTTYTIGEEATAKNVLAVGSVVDYAHSAALGPGDLWNEVGTGSSVGPAGDDRWKPNLVAPGRWVKSVDGSTSSGFMEIYGTSMAAPHVTGALADLIDSAAGWAYLPERMMAHSMATAFRHDDVNLNFSSEPHLDEYGAGRIDAFRSVYQSTQESWSSWSFFLAAGESTHRDFYIPPGASRLVMAMTYVEAGASAGASQALINDFDSYLDQPPLAAGDNTGDWLAQQSSIDNTELRVVNNPVNGTWRVKVWPRSTTSGAYFGLTVFVQAGPANPTVALALTKSADFVRPTYPVDFQVVATSSGSTADGVFLDTNTAGDVLIQTTANLKDGSIADLTGNHHGGRDILLGSIGPLFSRDAKWRMSWATEGVKSFLVQATGDNFAGVFKSTSVTVDGTAPSAPASAWSTTHTIGAWSTNPTAVFAWSPGSDALSGVDGYSVGAGTGSSYPIDTVLDLEETATAAVLTLPSSANLYFGVRTIDNAGNVSSVRYTGPYSMDNVPPAWTGTLLSSTHVPGVLSCSTSLAVQFTSGATDDASGVAGYIAVVDSSPFTVPTGAVNLPSGVTGYTANIGSSTSARYLHVRPRDVAGNYGPAKHFGPILANSGSVISYCTAKLNSLGCSPQIDGLNPPSKSAGSFQVTCTNVINQRIGLLFWGFDAAATPFQGGTLCVQPPTLRTPSLSSGGPTSGTSCSGQYSFTWTTSYLNLNSINVGDTIHCQWWMRDPASPSTTGLSNALKFTVCQ